jgi:uncharacterized phiE125 gp8 family phage protein
MGGGVVCRSPIFFFWGYEMKTRIVTPPSGLVVTLAQAKSILRIQHDNLNQIITDLSLAAEEFIEKETNHFFLTRTIDAYFDSFDDITITHRPNVEIEDVVYRDLDGAWQSIDLGEFDVDPYGLDTFAFIDSAPELGTYSAPVRVRYSVGYGNSSDVPYDLRRAIEGMIQYWYENPSTVVTGTIASELPLHVANICQHYRVVDV